MNLIGLIKSKTREKILRFFFSNKEKKYYLRELERILKLSVGNIRRELISLEELGLFKHEKIGNLVYYYLNITSPLFEVIENVILKNKKTKDSKIFKEELKSEKDLMVIKKDEFNLLFSKINELESILESVLQNKSEIEDFLNLGVVINNRREVLLVKRVKQEKGRRGAVLSWVFPGGKQRLSENRSECVARGVLVETGYQVESIKEISYRFHPQFPVFIVYHLCKLVLPKAVAEPRQPHEISEIKWVKIKEIKNFITSDLDSKVAETLNSLKNSKS